jgi:hypothetical protein
MGFQNTQQNRPKCPIPGCKAKRHPMHVMCRDHWHMVPRSKQGAVWRTYRKDAGSTEHLAAIAQAIAAVTKEVASKATGS